MLNVQHQSSLSDFTAQSRADRETPARALPVPQREPGRLTPRQMQVCELLSQGMTNKQIADRLGLTPGTVKVFISRDIFVRLGLTSRLAVALWYRSVERQSALPPVVG